MITLVYRADGLVDIYLDGRLLAMAVDVEVGEHLLAEQIGE